MNGKNSSIPWLKVEMILNTGSNIQHRRLATRKLQRSTAEFLLAITQPHNPEVFLGVPPAGRLGCHMRGFRQSSSDIASIQRQTRDSEDTTPEPSGYDESQ